MKLKGISEWRPQNEFKQTNKQTNIREILALIISENERIMYEYMYTLIGRQAQYIWFFSFLNFYKLFSLQIL